MRTVRLEFGRCQQRDDDDGDDDRTHYLQRLNIQPPKHLSLRLFFFAEPEYLAFQLAGTRRPP